MVKLAIAYFDEIGTAKFKTLSYKTRAEGVLKVADLDRELKGTSGGGIIGYEFFDAA